jgi:hypothetical protein
MAGAMLDLALATPEKTLFLGETAPPGQEKQTTWDVARSCKNTKRDPFMSRIMARN